MTPAPPDDERGESLDGATVIRAIYAYNNWCGKTHASIISVEEQDRMRRALAVARDFYTKRAAQVVRDWPSGGHAQLNSALTAAHAKGRAEGVEECREIARKQMMGQMAPQMSHQYVCGHDDACRRIKFDIEAILGRALLPAPPAPDAKACQHEKAYPSIVTGVLRHLCEKCGKELK